MERAHLNHHNIIPISLMASKRSEIAELNNILFRYLELLGMSEEAKLEFRRRANLMEALGFYRSSWFHSLTAGLSQSLHQIQQPARPEIDLNEPPPPQHNDQVPSILFRYLEELGMSDEAKLEFRRRANLMEARGFSRSPWFHSLTAGVSQSLHQIQQPARPEIDLNDPPPPQHNRVEDEGSSNGRGKRKRVGRPLRIREHNIRPSNHHNNQLSPIQLSDDSD